MQAAKHYNAFNGGAGYWVRAAAEALAQRECISFTAAEKRIHDKRFVPGPSKRKSSTAGQLDLF